MKENRKHWRGALQRGGGAVGLHPPGPSGLLGRAVAWRAQARCTSGAEARSQL